MRGAVAWLTRRAEKVKRNTITKIAAWAAAAVGISAAVPLCAAGCNMGIGHEPNGGMTTLEIAKDELPPGQSLTFAVRPLSSLGTSGKAIATEFKV